MTTGTRQANYVAAQPDVIDVQPLTTSLVRREDVTTAVTQLLDTYSQQQRDMLSHMTPQAQSHSGIGSTAEEIDSRRRTSGMYLRHYLLTVAATCAGICFLAWLVGMEAGAAFGVWLFATGALSLYLAWLRHGDELHLSREALTHHMIDTFSELALYRAATERKSLRWQNDADARRLELAEAQAAQAREAASLRLKQLELQRDMAQRRHAEPQDSPLAAPAQPVQPVDTFAHALTDFVVSLYDRNPDGSFRSITPDGVLLVRAPWSARGSWQTTDKARAAKLLAGTPTLIEQVAGGRLRLLLREYPTPADAVTVLTWRLKQEAQGL